MAFPQFLVLFVISVVVSAVLHYSFSYYVVGGTKSFFGKIMIGYFGALFAGTIVGSWELIPGLMFANVALIPTILGSAAMIVLAVDVTETFRGRRTI